MLQTVHCLHSHCGPLGGRITLLWLPMCLCLSLSKALNHYLSVSSRRSWSAEHTFSVEWAVVCVLWQRPQEWSRIEEWWKLSLTSQDTHIRTCVGVCTPLNYVCAHNQSIFFTKIKTLSVCLGTYTHSVITVLMTFFHTHMQVWLGSSTLQVQLGSVPDLLEQDVFPKCKVTYLKKKKDLKYFFKSLEIS